MSQPNLPEDQVTHVPPPQRPVEDRNKALREELSSLLNRHCAENFSNTPDFLLAEFMLNCLSAFEVATKRRDSWYDVDLRPGRRTGHGL